MIACGTPGGGAFALVRPKGLAMLAAAALPLVVLACGEPDPEKALEEASAELASAREVLAAADGDINELRARMRELETQLTDAERVRREAQRHVNEAETLVTERASDDVLFRAVQRRLLEDSKLADAAVTARVSSRVVTLTGEVANDALRKRAIAVAEAAPGVAQVVSELRVPRAEPAAD